MLNQTATAALRAIPTKFISLENWKTVGGAARCANVDYENFLNWTESIPDATIQKWGTTDFVNEEEPGLGADAYKCWLEIDDAEVDAIYRMADQAGDWPGHWRTDGGLSTVLELAQRYDPSNHDFLDGKPGFPLDGIGVLPEQCNVKNPRLAGRQAGGCLVVPMHDGDELVNLHLVQIRRNWDDGSITTLSVPLLAGEGGWFTFGAAPADGVVYVCESLESAWACWRATGATAVASSLGFDHEDCYVVNDLRSSFPGALALVTTPRTAEFAHDIADGLNAVSVVNFTKESPDFSAFDMLKRDGRAVLKKLLENAIPAAETGPRFALLTCADLALTKPSEWAIDGVLPASGLAAIYGPSGVGKSFFALDAVAAIAEGRDWFGHSTNARPIVYSVLEGQDGFKHRVRAWEQHHGRKLPQSIRLMMSSFNITNDGDVTDFAAVLPKGGIVVIDTLNAAAAGVDENGSVGMGLILAGAKRLAQITGGLTVAVHHSGKSEGAGLRGHSSLVGALDTAIFVSTKAGRCTWTTDIARGGKSKDGTPSSGTFGLDVVTLPDGVTSCVVNADTTAAPTMPPRLRDALDAFERVAELEGDGVSLEAWRDAFYTACPALTPDAKRKAFQRVRTDLLKTGVLELADGLFHQITPKHKPPTITGTAGQDGTNQDVSRPATTPI
jgi:putative DNA primase/helicase